MNLKSGKICFGDTNVQFNSDESYETDEYFEICLSAYEEKRIDGYYRIKIIKENTSIRIEYLKLQSGIPLLYGNYILKNNESAQNTVNGLLTLIF